jgi:hypothetical protein
MRRIIDVKVANRKYYYSACCDDRCDMCPIRFTCYTITEDFIEITLETMRKNSWWLKGKWKKYNFQGQEIHVKK